MKSLIAIIAVLFSLNTFAQTLCPAGLHVAGKKEKLKEGILPGVLIVNKDLKVSKGSSGILLAGSNGFIELKLKVAAVEDTIIPAGTVYNQIRILKQEEVDFLRNHGKKFLDSMSMFANKHILLGAEGDSIVEALEITSKKDANAKGLEDAGLTLCTL